MEKDNAENVKNIRVSSAFTRVVGTKKLDVYNTKQTPGLPKSAYKNKWVVIEATGKKNRVVATFTKKAPAILKLRNREIELKAEKTE